MYWSKNIYWISVDLCSKRSNELIAPNCYAEVITFSLQVNFQICCKNPKTGKTFRYVYFDFQGSRAITPENAIERGVIGFMRMTEPTNINFQSNKSRIRVSRGNISKLEIYCSDRDVKRLFEQQFNVRRWGYYQKINQK